MLRLTVLVVLMVMYSYGVAVSASWTEFTLPIDNLTESDFKHVDLYDNNIRLDGTSLINFRIKSFGTARLLLQRDRGDYSNNIIGIAFGYMNASNIAVHKDVHDTPVIEYLRTDILSGTEYRDFWVRLDNGCVEVDTVSSPSLNGSMSWCAFTHALNYISIGAGFDAKVSYQFEQSDINECSSIPCMNGGTCTDGVNSYICSCIPGYTGTNCQTDINECASVPCKNGGTCIDAVNNYSCSCLQGSTGTRCEFDINECASDPCQNGGVCINVINDYYCSCLPGYTGTNCETDPCDSNPCQNGTTCNNAGNTYTCTSGSGVLTCYPNQTIHLTNPNSAVYTHFTAFYDVAGARTNCTGSADSTKDNVYFECASTTATVTIYISDRTLSDDFILGGQARAYTFWCAPLSDHNRTVTGHLNVSINETDESTTPTYNITAGFFSTTGVEVTSAQVGETVYFIITGPAEFDLVPLECNATGTGGEYKTVIVNGCFTDTSLMTSFLVQNGSIETDYNSTLYVFKFYNSVILTITCNVKVCVDGSCPISCGTGGRRKRAITDTDEATIDDVKTTSVGKRLDIIEFALGGSQHTTGSITLAMTMALLIAFLKI